MSTPSPEEAKLRDQAHHVLDRLIDSVGGEARLRFLGTFNSLAFVGAQVELGVKAGYRAFCQRMGLV